MQANFLLFTFYRAMRMHKRGICCDAVCVRPSVTFVDHGETNKHIFEIFSTHATYCVIIAGVSPGETKMWAAVR